MNVRYSLRDIGQDPETPTASREVAHAIGYRSILGVPMLELRFAFRLGHHRAIAGRFRSFAIARNSGGHPRCALLAAADISTRLT